MKTVVGVRTKDRWVHLLGLLCRLLDETFHKLVIVDQSTSLPSPHIISVFRALNRPVEIVPMHPDPIQSQVRLFDAVRTYDYLVQIDDDVMPLTYNFVVKMVNFLERSPKVAFVLGCTQEVGRPSPPDSHNKGFPNYLRWHDVDRALPLDPRGVALCFTAVRLSVLPEWEAWLDDQAWWRSLQAHSEVHLNDLPYGLAATACGHQAVVLTDVKGYHFRPVDRSVAVRNSARGVLLSELWGE